MANVVYVVDDDAAIRESLSLLLEVHGLVTESFDSAEAFLARLETPFAAGCVLADMRMGGMSGLQLLRHLRAAAIPLPLIVITGHGDVPMAVAALKAGAVDFLEKPYDDGLLLRTVRQCLTHCPQPGGRLAELVQANAALRESLTPRERQVMELVAVGEPNKVIAHRLGISMRTVEIHRANLMEKMQARTLADLIRAVTLLELGEGLWTGPESPLG